MENSTEGDNLKSWAEMVAAEAQIRQFGSDDVQPNFPVKERQNGYCTLLLIAGQRLALSPQLFSARDSSTLWVTIAMVMFGCFLAFMISVAEFLLLSHTSSLTLTISGIFKVR